jgi:hypothetical protein
MWVFLGKHVGTEIRFRDTNHPWVFNKRVHGYEYEKVWTCGNQTIDAEPMKVSVATNKHTIIEEVLEMLISVGSFPKL